MGYLFGLFKWMLIGAAIAAFGVWFDAPKGFIFLAFVVVICADWIRPKTRAEREREEDVEWAIADPHGYWEAHKDE